MTERPIIFSAPMVRALLAREKTQTRRVVKPPGVEPWRQCPYGVPGDRLWVREGHALIWPEDDPPERVEDHVVEYRADGDERRLPGEWPADMRGDSDCPRWRPSIYMPRWASRHTLAVADVRAERVADISTADALAEGLGHLHGYHGSTPPIDAAIRFGELWDRLHAKPKAVRQGGRIIRYESYPFAGVTGIGVHRGLPHHVYANPWVWVVGLEEVK